MIKCKRMYIAIERHFSHWVIHTFRVHWNDVFPTKLNVNNDGHSVSRELGGPVERHR